MSALGATKTQSEGEDTGPVKSGAGRKGNLTLLADSVSMAEQKAKGDVKKKGRLDPYAYIPLNRTKLNRRYVLGGAGLAGMVAARLGAPSSKEGRASFSVNSSA